SLTSMTVLVGDGTLHGTEITMPVSGDLQSLLITEQKVPGSTITKSLSIYLDGELTVMPIGTVNVYGCVPDSVQLATDAGTLLDEVQPWTRDMSADLEMLCENGLDGQWDLVTGTCELVN